MLDRASRQQEPQCIGCGWCCATGPCLEAYLKIGIITAAKLWDQAVDNGRMSWSPCPYLIWDGQRHWCSIHDLRHLTHLRWLFGPDNRCIMPDSSWRYRQLRDRTKPNIL